MIRGVTAVSPITVAIFAGPNRLPIEAVSEADAGVQGIIGQATSHCAVSKKIILENIAWLRSERL